MVYQHSMNTSGLIEGVLLEALDLKVSDEAKGLFTQVKNAPSFADDSVTDDQLDKCLCDARKASKREVASLKVDSSAA